MTVSSAVPPQPRPIVREIPITFDTEGRPTPSEFQATLRMMNQGIISRNEVIAVDSVIENTYARMNDISVNINNEPIAATVHPRCSRCQQTNHRICTCRPTNTECVNCCSGGSFPAAVQSETTRVITPPEQVNPLLKRALDSSEKGGINYVAPSLIKAWGARPQLELTCSPKYIGFKNNPSRRLIGVEIESAGTKNIEVLAKAIDELKYSIVPDGSLPSYGFEIGTQPTNGDLFVSNIKKLCDSLKEGKAYVTGDCGLHVHADMSAANKDDLYKVICLYGAIEPALYSMQNKSRRSSKYCKSTANLAIKIQSGYSLENKYCMERLLYGVDSTAWIKEIEKEQNKDAKKKLYGDFKKIVDGIKKQHGPAELSRYYSLNIHSYFFRKTLECRLHEGTVDGDEIANWGILFASIIDAGIAMSHKEAKALKIAANDTTNYISVWIDSSKAKALEVLLGVAPAKLHTYIKERVAKYAK